MASSSFARLVGSAAAPADPRAAAAGAGLAPGNAGNGPISSSVTLGVPSGVPGALGLVNASHSVIQTGTGPSAPAPKTPMNVELSQLWNAACEKVTGRTYVSKTDPKYPEVRACYDAMKKEKLPFFAPATEFFTEKQQVWRQTCLAVAQKEIVRKTDPEYSLVLSKYVENMKAIEAGTAPKAF